MKTVYVGNLSKHVSDSELKQLFAPYGSVTWANVVWNKSGDISQGFGFVEMESELLASTAILGLNGSIMRGKRLKVGEAKRKSH